MRAKTKWRRPCAAAAAVLSSLTAATVAAETSATAVASALHIGGEGLALGGCAVRNMFGVKLYSLAVYLPSGRDLLSAEADPRSPLALQITPLHGRESAPFPSGWRRRLSGRIPADQLQGLERVHAGLRSGEPVLFAYHPEHGTRILKGGEALLTTPGPGLLRAMLAMWLHDDPPISQEIRQALLSGRCILG